MTSKLPFATVADETPDEFILEIRGDTMSVPKTDYLTLKYRDFEGAPITHTWDDSSYVIETVEDGLFECWHNGKRMQIFDTEGIAKAIRTNDVNAYVRIFEEWYSTQIQHHVIEILLGAHAHRIQIQGGIYVIDELFAVDQHGTVSYRTSEDDSWESMCVIMETVVENSTMNLPQLGNTKVHPATLCIIGKIHFLLHATSEDQVFCSQLPPQLQELIKKRADIPEDA